MTAINIKDVLELRKLKVSDRRAEVERLIEVLASDTDAELLERIDEAVGAKLDFLHRVGGGNLLWAGSHVDVLRYVAFKRGLWQPPDKEREFYEWLERELSQPGGLH